MQRKRQTNTKNNNISVLRPNKNVIIVRKQIISAALKCPIIIPRENIFEIESIKTMR